MHQTFNKVCFGNTAEMKDSLTYVIIPFLK